MLFSLLNVVEGEDISSALDKAEVRLPYAELKKLWEASQATIKPVEPIAPPAGALLAARYSLDISSGSLIMSVEFKAESFAGKWEKIPLMGADIAVASVEPEDTRVVIENDYLCLMAKESGSVTVTVRFNEQPLPQTEDMPFVRLITAHGAVGSLQIKGIPDTRLLKIKNGQLLKRSEGVASIALPAKGGELCLYLTDASLEKKAEPPPPIHSSEWTLQNEVLAYEGDGEICYRIKTHAMALNGSALNMTMLLPANARSIKLDGADDLSDWKMSRNKDGQSEVHLQWTTRDIMERSFRLSYAMQKLPLDTEWELKAPTFMSDDKTKSFFMFPLASGVEIKADNLQSPVPLSKLSKWVAEENSGTEFGTIIGGSMVKIQTRLLPRMETAVAIITKSQYSTHLVSDGSVLTEASLEIEHDTGIRWSFSLPEKSELLKCSVDGSSVQPIARDKGIMEIPLSNNSEKKGRSQVAFSYTAAKGKLQEIEGQVTLELPQTALFISELLWSVEVPETYEISATEGNTTTSGHKGAASPNTVSLIKKLCRDERPQTQLFYRKRGLE